MEDGVKITHEVVEEETEKFLAGGGIVTELESKKGPLTNTANPMLLTQYVGVAQKRPQWVDSNFEG